MRAVTDTSPLHYLILIGQADLLPQLYTQLILPQAVVGELLHPHTPLAVRSWIQALPPWCTVRQPQHGVPRELGRLGAGEREAILLVEELEADILLVDEEAGRKAAQQRGIPRTGTLGILGTAGMRDLVDFPTAVVQLQATTFRMPPPAIVQAILAHYATRKRPST
jgi:predicted nucleic acid-binding protein